MTEPSAHHSTGDDLPDSTAARTALWRALHLYVDAAPHVIEDDIGLRLLAPPDDWRSRGDMDPEFTRPFRASIVARARFIEEYVVDEAKRGVMQYVILGAGLDSFAQRRLADVPGMTVFEIDRPATQRWKRDRLDASGFGVPDALRFVPFDFEVHASWRDALVEVGFDAARPAVVVSTGVSMYLTHAANAATLRDVADMARGTSFVMTFLLPLEMADDAVRPGLETAEKRARASGTPFISFFRPQAMLELARTSGFGETEHVAASELTRRYFASRTDGLKPPDHGEELLVARVV